MTNTKFKTEMTANFQNLAMVVKNLKENADHLATQIAIMQDKFN